MDIKRGRHWHVQTGRMILTHYQPPSEAPWCDLAATSWVAVDDGKTVDERHYHGWAFRWPRMVIAFRKGTVPARLHGRWKYRELLRRSRRRGGPFIAGAEQYDDPDQEERLRRDPPSTIETEPR